MVYNQKYSKNPDNPNTRNGQMPEKINTPESTTMQNMWAWIYNELQRIITLELNPLRLRVYRYDSKALMPYHATLKTIQMMFNEFLKKDFEDEKNQLDEYFGEFLKDYNEAEKLKNNPNPNHINTRLNDLYYKCLVSLEKADELLARIRQMKGFGYNEGNNFVITDRAEQAIRINNNVTDEILTIFKKQKAKKLEKEQKVKEE